jgi:hypothetical protein
MKQTALQWLVENLNSEPYSEEEFNYNSDCWDKAKEMEKEQIIEACENTIKSFELDKDKTGFFAMGGEGYYKQTFEQ